MAIVEEIKLKLSADRFEISDGALERMTPAQLQTVLTLSEHNDYQFKLFCATELPPDYVAFFMQTPNVTIYGGIDAEGVAST